MNAMDVYQTACTLWVRKNVNASQVCARLRPSGSERTKAEILDHHVKN